MFKPVSSQVDWTRMEEGVLRFWQEHDIFRKSLAQREGAPRFVFYEGPPTANGLPHVGHMLGRAIKDLIPRYRTMKGDYVLRKAGWDCHGLPVEIEVEKELGFEGKQAIETYGVARFNEKCRESVFRYVDEWRRLTDRIGFWIDLDNPYITMSRTYIESVWWILKQLWDRDLLYQGFRVVPYCPRCGTALSDHEVAQGYEEAEDPSLYVKFRWQDRPDTFFLVWTTTPWTLPANVALAISPDMRYARVEQSGEYMVLAEELLAQALRGDYRVVETMYGRDLLGVHYEPLYRFLPVDKDYAYVIAGDFVSAEEGTGIVHIAPAFGADDMAAGLKYDLPVLQTVDLSGNFVDAVQPWKGMFVKQADPAIVDDLRRRGLLYHVGRYQHTYPFCWRCHAPLLYYAKSTWLVRTTACKDRMLETNQQISWYPEYIKDGRFGNWLANNVDWALGRERFWGTPLPVWQCRQCGAQEAYGSVAELETAAGRSLAEVDLHRPYVDEVAVPCKQCGGEMRRVPEVIDTWFDSGSMPVAQWHYPFENKAQFAEQFPADFVSEGIDQTRGWFYTLHAISNLLFGEKSFNNCVVSGLMLDAEGRKMSKSLGNRVDPWDALDAHGADALRWYIYASTVPWSEHRFSFDALDEVYRKFLLTLWNTYSFFVTYANLDGFVPGQAGTPVPQRPALDRWVLAELNALVQSVDEALGGYDITGAARPIARFVDDLSNWYVRRSRRRFWKSEHDADKSAAYATLYECLTTLARLLAPFTPFVADEIYQNLVRTHDAAAAESVHLADFPAPDLARIDRELMAGMRLAMRVVSLGHAARNKASLKVRQPLAEALVGVRTAEERQRLLGYLDVITDELNVKAVRISTEEGELVSFVVRPMPSVLGKKYGPRFPAIRSAAMAMPPEQAARLRGGQSVTLAVDGEEVELHPDEVEIQLNEKEGYAVAEEGGYVVGITTTLTEALRREGLAREVVRRIQVMRKDAGFNIDDQIVTHFQAGEDLSQVLADWAEYIRQETLTVRLVNASPPSGAYTEPQKVDGQMITLGIAQA